MPFAIDIFGSLFNPISDWDPTLSGVGEKPPASAAPSKKYRITINSHGHRYTVIVSGDKATVSGEDISDAMRGKVSEVVKAFAKKYPPGSCGKYLNIKRTQDGKGFKTSKIDATSEGLDVAACSAELVKDLQKVVSACLQACEHCQAAGAETLALPSGGSKKVEAPDILPLLVNPEEGTIPKGYRRFEIILEGLPKIWVHEKLLVEWFRAAKIPPEAFLSLKTPIEKKDPTAVVANFNILIGLLRAKGIELKAFKPKEGDLAGLVEEDSLWPTSQQIWCHLLPIVTLLLFAICMLQNSREEELYSCEPYFDSKLQLCRPIDDDGTGEDAVNEPGVELMLTYFKSVLQFFVQAFKDHDWKNAPLIHSPPV